MAHQISFFRKLDTILEDATTDGKKELADFCSGLKEIIQSGYLSTYKKANKILSYWGYPDSYVSKVLGMSEGAVRVARRTISKELYGKFGIDFLILLEEGTKNSIQLCKARLDLVQKNRSALDYIPNVLIDEVVKNAKQQEFSIEDCYDEIMFLNDFCIPTFKSRLKGLNADKVLYLIKVLNREIGDDDTSFRLMSKFEGGTK